MTDPDVVASASVDLLKKLEKSIAALGARMVVVVFPAAPVIAGTLANAEPESMERKLTRILTKGSPTGESRPWISPRRSRSFPGPSRSICPTTRFTSTRADTSEAPS